MGITGQTDEQYVSKTAVQPQSRSATRRLPGSHSSRVFSATSYACRRFFYTRASTTILLLWRASKSGNCANYSRARVIYEQARLLLPNDGNASHQLAILSSYQKDSFRSLLHYYRALCVQHPYDTASDNLNTVLKKSLDQYRVSKANQGDDSQAVQKIRVDRFLELVVVLHGLWYLDSDE